jgi:hypothetical protein
MVHEGGIYVIEERVTEVEATFTPTDVTDEGILLRGGKKKYHRLLVA